MNKTNSIFINFLGHMRMKFSPIFPALALLVLAGCNSDSAVIVVDSASTDEISNEAEGTSSSIVELTFTGATFVAVNQLGANPAAGEGLLSFTDDTVTWTRAGLVEVGSYTDTGDQELVASFADRDIAFEERGFNLIWNSLSYNRTVGTQFDSQESLVEYLDGTTFTSTTPVTAECVLSVDDNGVISDSCTVGSDSTTTPVIAECVLSVDDNGVISDSCTGSSASPVGPGNLMESGSLQFNGDEVFWAEGDAVSVGTYTYIDNKSFKANFLNQELTVVVLSQDQLVIDSVVYNKDLTNQFDSQAALVAFLDGASYRSAGLQSLGETGSETELGYWFVDFTSDTFTWAYEDVSEAGTVSFLDGNSFTAMLSDRELTIEVEGDDILWDGVRYIVSNR